MKKAKKLASLFLAMLMAFSLMAVTASAYDAGHEHGCRAPRVLSVAGPQYGMW